MRLLFLLPAFVSLWKRKSTSGLVQLEAAACFSPLGLLLGRSGSKPCSLEALQQQMEEEQSPRAALRGVPLSPGGHKRVQFSSRARGS